MAQAVIFLLVTLLSLQTIHAEPAAAAATNVYTAGRGLTGILDYVKQVIESARTTIKNITESLGALIDEFRDSINETVAGIPIYRIINQLKTEIASTVGEGGSLSERCGKQADVQVSELDARANKESQACQQAPQMVVTQLKNTIKDLANRAWDMLDQFTIQVVTCAQNNKFNPISLAKCLQSEIDVFKQEMDDIQDEVELSVAEAKNNAKESVYKLASCVNDVQLNTIKTAQTILANVETCMSGK